MVMVVQIVYFIRLEKPRYWSIYCIFIKCFLVIWNDIYIFIYNKSCTTIEKTSIITDVQSFPLLSVSLFLFSLLTMKTVLLMLFIFNIKLLNRVIHSRFACTYNSKRIYMKIAFSCYEFQGKSRIIDDRAVYRKEIIVKLTQTNDMNFYYI